MALIMARFLTDESRIRLRAVIANLRPGRERARLVRGTLDLLGLQNVPVGIGTDGGSATHEANFDATAPYATPLHTTRMSSLEPGRALLHRTLVAAPPRSLTLLCISSLKDAALFVRDNSALCQSRLKHVVVMGGVKLVAEHALSSLHEEEEDEGEDQEEEEGDDRDEAKVAAAAAREERREGDGRRGGAMDDEEQQQRQRAGSKGDADGAPVGAVEPRERSRSALSWGSRSWSGRSQLRVGSFRKARLAEQQQLQGQAQGQAYSGADGQLPLDGSDVADGRGGGPTQGRARSGSLGSAGGGGPPVRLCADTAHNNMFDLPAGARARSCAQWWAGGGLVLGTHSRALLALDTPRPSPPSASPVPASSSIAL
jgi:hypothetical protein